MNDFYNQMYGSKCLHTGQSWIGMKFLNAYVWAEVGQSILDCNISNRDLPRLGKWFSGLTNYQGCWKAGGNGHRLLRTTCPFEFPYFPKQMGTYVDSTFPNIKLQHISSFFITEIKSCNKLPVCTSFHLGIGIALHYCSAQTLLVEGIID